MLDQYGLALAWALAWLWIGHGFRRPVLVVVVRRRSAFPPSPPLFEYRMENIWPDSSYASRNNVDVLDKLCNSLDCAAVLGKYETELSGLLHA